MYAIINTRLILEDSIIWDGALTFDNGKIVEAGRAGEVTIPHDAQILDAHGLYTAPGLIDLHNHGCPDFLFHENPAACAEFFLRHGQTTVLPTFYCNLTLQQMLDGLRRVQEASRSGAGKIIGGLYMEGPYMNGTGSNQKYILWGGEVDPAEYGPLLDQMAGFARVWAIDPQRPGI